MMLRKNSYPMLEPNEPIKVPRGRNHANIACCDCGLVHTFVFNTKSAVEIFILRNGRSTGQMRRNKRGYLLNGEDEKWKMVKRDNPN